MAEAKVKKILIDLGTVRIVEVDDLNVMFERLEESVNPSTKVVSEKWRTKGYYGTIKAGLRAIIRNELLINNNALGGLESHLNEVVKSNNEILKSCR